MHIDASDGSENVGDAIRATEADTEDAVRDTQEDEAMTHQPLDLLGSRDNDPYDAGVGDAARGYAGRGGPFHPSRCAKANENSPVTRTN